MSTAPRNWLLAAAALLALFQAWLWFASANLGLSFALLAIAVGLLVAAFAPRSALSRVLRRVWAPSRREDETERAYRLRIAAIWLLCAAVAIAALYFLPIHEASHDDELHNQLIFWPFAIFTFCAIFMAVQSAALALKSQRHQSGRVEDKKPSPIGGRRGARLNR